MSDDLPTPEAVVGSNAFHNYQRAFDSLGPPGSPLLYDHVQHALTRALDTLVKEMKKTHQHLSKRRLLVAQLSSCIERQVFPSNLCMKLAPQIFPSTIDEGLVASHNHAELALWNTFKLSLLSHRTLLIKTDLDSLEESFSLYSDTTYLQQRFLKLAPAISQHSNVINGLVLSFSVTLGDFLSRVPTSKKRSKSSSSSSNTSIASSATSDDDMTVDEPHSQPSANTGSSSSSSSASSSSSSSSRPKRTNSSSSKALTLQEQIDNLTRLVELSLTKNNMGTLPQRERPARASSPATPNRISRLPTTTTTAVTPPNSSDSFLRRPGRKSPQQPGKSSLKSTPTTFPTTFHVNPVPPNPQGPPFQFPPPTYYYGHIGPHIPQHQLYGQPPPVHLPYGHHPPPLPDFLLPNQPDPTLPPEPTRGSARSKAPGNRGKSNRPPPVRFAAYNPPKIFY